MVFWGFGVTSPTHPKPAPIAVVFTTDSVAPRFFNVPIAGSDFHEMSTAKSNIMLRALPATAFTVIGDAVPTLNAQE